MRGKQITAIAFLLMLAAVACADSPVWQIEKGGHRLFVGGTIHLLGENDYPLPPGFEQAYKQANMLVLETDLAGLQAPEFQQTLLMAMSYQDGRTLKTVLKPETYRALELHLQETGLSIEHFMGFRPAMVAITLTVIEMQRLGLAGQGVDQYFSDRAVDDKKQLSSLETVQQQLSFMVDMGNGHEDAFVLYSLNQLDDLPHELSLIKQAWRQGDMEKLDSVALQPWRRDFPKIYASLLVDRNNDWIPKIETMLKTPEVELVLVGALHLVGNDGLLAKLVHKGYKLKMLE